MQSVYLKLLLKLGINNGISCLNIGPADFCHGVDI